MKNLQRFSPFFIALFTLFLSSFSFAGNSRLESAAATELISSEAGLSVTLACSTPTWPTTSNITNSSATFSWDAVSGAVSYAVQTRVPNGTWYTVPNSPFNNTTTTVDWFLPNTTYEWRVRANCYNGEYSYWTYPVTFTTSGWGYCDAPGWLYTNNITQTSATFDWDPVSGAQSYALQYRLAGGSWWDVPGGPWTQTWFTINNLQPGTAYEWRVRSNCSNWMYSSWSYPASFTTLGYSCSTPTWPVTSNITQNSASFSWEESWGAQSYSVQIRLLNGNWYDLPGNPYYNTWASATGLNPNTTYQWRVRANCGYYQYSNWTYPVNFTTLGGYSCDRPYWLYTSNITQTSATLNWEGVYGAYNYTIEFRTANGNWYILPGGPFSGTWTNVNGLQPGTNYEWRVRTTCSNWQYSQWSYIETFSTLGYSCHTPTWPVTSNVTQSSATFSWDEVWGAESYTVQTRLPNGYWYDVPGSPTYGTWITMTGLNPCTTYQWRVKANCGWGQYSYWTQPVSFTTVCYYSCEAPSWLYTSNITQSSASLGWDAVPGAVSYSVQYRLANGTWYDLQNGPFYSNWAYISNLQPGATYEWRVRSNCSNWSYSSWSWPVTFTTLGYSCHVPSWLSTTGITQTSATFNWSSVWGAWSYTVQYRQPNGTWVDVPGSPTTYTSITLNGLYPGTTYQWRVRTDCEDGSHSYWSLAVTFTTSGVSYCNAPYWLYTTYITESSANLDWSPVSGALSYDLQIKLYGSNTWIDITGGPWTETWYTVTGLTPGATYQWRVRSNCYAGSYSEWSNPATFTTLGYSCYAPTYTSTTNVTETSATFNWSNVPGAQTYSVELRVPNGSWYTAPGSPLADTTITVGGFIPGTTYQWRVRANCGGGNYSAWTVPLTFKTTGGTGPGSNECDSATVLTVNSNCVNSASSNVDATESSPPPMGWCPENNHKDVWFSFTMPDVSNPVVTIRTTAGSLSDAVMEVYRGGGCADLEYISCEDDNSTGNGSTMPVISVTGSANETIWVRVWGYAGTTGTFNICVFDYQSNNFATPDNSDESVIDGRPIDVVEISDKPIKNNTGSATLQVSPNPTRDILQIRYAQTVESTVTRIVMLDMSGKMVDNREYQSTGSAVFSDQLDVSSLAPGMYVLRVITTSGIMTEKVSVID